MKGIDLNRYIEILDPQLEFVIRNLLTYKKEKIFILKNLYQKVLREFRYWIEFKYSNGIVKFILIRPQICHINCTGLS